jgi:glyoxylase-like metal-dependent hydrolase (beta-lactamase superfamily II)
VARDVTVHPLASPWGRFSLYSFFIDAPEPAIVDTGIASSPAEGMAPALRALGRRIEDVRWILLTHGHIDHVGGPPRGSAELVVAGPGSRSPARSRDRPR